MAFQTNVLVNGEWRTRTLGVDDILQHHDRLDAQAPVQLQETPVLGLLSQTVFRSPLAHWILPGNFRSPECNDVAFIGVG